jgi:Predicted NADH:ubiquinone oxidoreductase, subunit RnfG
MAAQSNLKNMVMVLGLTCLACSAVLGGAYALTKNPIDAANVAKTNKAIGAVLPAFDETTYESVDVDGKTYNYYKAVKGGETVGYAVESTVVGFGGPLSLMVGITPDGTVHNTSVLSHARNPGPGRQVQHRRQVHGAVGRLRPFREDPLRQEGRRRRGRHHGFHHHLPRLHGGVENAVAAVKSLEE